MKKITYTLLIAFFSLASFAQEIKEDSLALLMQATQNYYDSINKSFTYQTGEILLDGGMAKIKTPDRKSVV